MRSHNKCCTCRYWDVPLKDRETVETGECHRHTPRLGLADGQIDPLAHWPCVHSDEWCGEHEEAWYGTEEGPDDRRKLFSKINRALLPEDREAWNRFLADLRCFARQIGEEARATLEPNPRMRRFAERLRGHLIGVPYLEG